MSASKSFSVVIPAFNEEDTLNNFLKDLEQALSGIDESYEILLVDDGSSDNTFVIAKNTPGIKALKHPYNKGNGAAVKTGIMNAMGEKLVIIDSDGQHNPKHIPEMLRLLDEYDLVVGARDSFGIGRRGIGNFVVSKLASYLSSINIPDLTCGYRAFKREKMLEFIDLLPNGFSLPSTSTLAFATSGYNVKFIPISSKVRQGGKSSIRVTKDGIKFIVLIVRMVSLFKPLKIFAPISIFLFIIGCLWSLKTITYSGGLSPTVVLLFLGGIFTFLFGLLADHIAETRLSIGKISKLLLNQEQKK
jgi:glycosyltransferase involved in cell wall biosynthesis